MTPSNQAPGTWTAAARFIKKHWIWALVLATTLVYAPLAGNTGDEKARQRSLDTLAEIMGLVQKNTVEPPTSKQITHASIQGMLHSLDPHSNYMDENEYRMLRENQRGSFFGIGSIIQQQPDGIVIVSTVRGGPSEKAGIRAGDYIREIDGKNTEGWTSSQAVEKLRGEKGTIVEVAIQRIGFPDLLRFSLTRAEIPSNSVTFAFMLTPTTGFVAIKDFGETTSTEFEKAVQTLKQQGMKELVLDLRDNGGGILDAALGISQQLLGPDELIVSQKGRGGRDAGQTRTPKGAALDPFPLVILINRGSASASEIVTGAVQDHDRGLVVGTTSWGKGLVQSVITIGRSRGLLLTSARYYTPSGRSIQRDYQHGLDDYFLPEEDKEAATPKGPEYRTDLQRVVYGGGGITPDYYVSQAQLSTFAATLRGRYAAFFKFAIQEKDRAKAKVKPSQEADEAEMARFKSFLEAQKIPFTEAEWSDPDNQTHLRRQVAYELQNVLLGTEAGFRYLCAGDPQVKKALEVMPEADALLKKKLLSLQAKGSPKTVAVKR
ncbi:MAG TPA: S41 family peptidase [Holophaga sp.]|mgnify:CR=1 FL=1|nr:S41 family peptidase [Holophaga sp.]HPS66782.1 S41 family peptidase [Holophaga sp.]